MALNRDLFSRLVPFAVIAIEATEMRSGAIDCSFSLSRFV
jgi:hypothetical protein